MREAQVRSAFVAIVNMAIRIRATLGKQFEEDSVGILFRTIQVESRKHWSRAKRRREFWKCEVESL
jgi:hypothetical protein